MQRVVITGGAGFIGQCLVQKLAKRNYDVIVIDNIAKKDLNKVASAWGPNVEFYNEDIRDIEAISQILSNKDIRSCIHLAAKTSVVESTINPYETFDVNIAGTLSVVECCYRTSIKNIIFASSAAVYGNPGILPLAEDHNLRPISPYGVSKLVGENIISSYKTANKISSAFIFRFFNVYGTGQKHSEYSGVITKFCDRLTAKLPPIILGDGEQTRDFIHVSDVAEAIMLAVKHPNKDGIYNIGTGRPASVNQMALLLCKLFHSDLAPVHKWGRPNEIIHSFADTRKARKLLNFECIKDLESGLEEMISL